MGERAVSFGHTVHVFFAFEGTALILVSVDYFSGQFVGHSLAAAFAGVDNEIFMEIDSLRSARISVGT